MGQWEMLPMAQVKQQYPQAYWQRGQQIAQFCPPGRRELCTVSAAQHCSIAANCGWAAGRQRLCNCSSRRCESLSVKLDWAAASGAAAHHCTALRMYHAFNLGWNVACRTEYSLPGAGVSGKDNDK